MEFSSLDINASALTAQRLRMDTISGNLANVQTTRQPDGTIGAYKRKEVIFAPLLHQSMSGTSGNNNESSVNFATGETNLFNRPDSKHVQMQGVHVVGITDDNKTPTRRIYDPGHPDADADGYVEMPNVNVVKEMVDMISASRAYEANLTVVNNFKSMFGATIKI